MRPSRWKRCLRRLQVLLTTPLKNKLLGFLGTKNKVPPKPFSSTTFKRHLEVFFKEKRNTHWWVSSHSSSCRDYEELRGISTEASVRFLFRELCFTYQTQALLREEIYS